MQYADLGALDVEIATFVSQEQVLREYADRPVPAGVFLGIEKGICRFAFNQGAPAEDEYTAGVMCHEVAHAYRTYHGLIDPGRVEYEEELLTDVTTVYLGFGVLAANNSYRYRKGGLGYSYAWSTGMVGYLTPQAFAFLLALQMHSRGMAFSSCKKVLSQLEPNQAAFVRGSYDSIVEWEHELPERLGIPDRLDPIRALGPADVLRPLPDPPARIAESGPEIPSWQKCNFGKPVVPVVRTKTDVGLGAGIAAGLLLGVTLSIMLRSVWLWIPVALACTAIGLRWGRQRTYATCSHPECLAILPPAASACDRCGGRIEWTVPDREDAGRRHTG